MTRKPRNSQSGSRRPVDSEAAARSDGPKPNPEPLANGRHGVAAEPTDDDPLSTVERKALDAIVAKNREINELRLDLEMKTDLAKLARKALEAASNELSLLITKTAGDDKPMPLFARPKQTPDENEVQPDRWRSDSITSLAVYGIPDGTLNALIEAGIATIGALADYSAADKRLTDIDTIGAAKAEKIENALMDYWRDHPSHEVDDGEEWAARKQAEAAQAAETWTQEEAREGEATPEPTPDPEPGAGQVACNACNTVRLASPPGPCPQCGGQEYRLSKADAEAEAAAEARKSRRRKPAAV